MENQPMSRRMALRAKKYLALPIQSILGSLKNSIIRFYFPSLDSRRFQIVPESTGDPGGGEPAILPVRGLRTNPPQIRKKTGGAGFRVPERPKCLIWPCVAFFTGGTGKTVSGQ